jgi:dolichol-phosphate mannosyltransferase
MSLRFAEVKKRGAVVLPTFKETSSVYNLLIEIDLKIPENWHIIIVDDSPTDETEVHVLKAFNELKRKETTLHFLKNPKKSGRGAAVQQGFEFAVTHLDPEFVVEMDSDGSHTTESLLALLSAPYHQEFVIGSRYLPESQIVGWPLTRRIFSRLTNYILKSIFHIEINDWTNGLRRYSIETIDIQRGHKFQNKGFICLSEQILLLNHHDIVPFEVPITFIDRTHGMSSVTHMEIFQSLLGVLKLYIHGFKSR